MGPAGGRRAGLPAGDEAEGLQRPDVLAHGPIDGEIGAGASGLLALRDGDLVDGGVGLGLLAQGPHQLVAGGRGERVEAVTCASDRQVKGAFPVADGGGGGGRRRGSVRAGALCYGGHVRELSK